MQGRYNQIPRERKEELHKYISGIVKSKNQKIIAINSIPDHVHLFVGMNPSIALSDLIRDVKNNSTAFINKNGWVR